VFAVRPEVIESVLPVLIAPYLWNRNIVRPFLIYLHCYVGLLLVPFLVIVGLTGSALAFYHELDRWFKRHPSPID